MESWIVGITGATGTIYAKRFLERLREEGCAASVTISLPGQRVAREELGWELTGSEAEVEQRLKAYLGYREDAPPLRYYDQADIGCALASGSYPARGMVVIPASMATVAGIAHGISRNLIERAADVTLKERRPLLIVPRETPLNQIHLRNLLTLAEMGVVVAPPVPAFYSHPREIGDLIDFFIYRIMKLLGITSREAWHWD